MANYEDEYEDQQELAVAPSALAILNQSEHAAMVQTANLPANRRKLAEFDSKLHAYATHSQPIALSMFYSLGRAGKQIIGPSVRFAEIVAPCWRNCAVAARVVGDSATTVAGQGVFLDYEYNVRNAVEVPRRITDKEGKRYSEDMILVTSNAAMSIARRNSVLKGGVPRALWMPAYEDAQITAVGKAESHSQRVASAMDYLHKLGVTEWQIMNAVGVNSPKELETEHLLTMRVLCAEIKRGDKTIEQVFGSAYDKEIESLFTQLKMNQAQQTMLRNSYMGRAKELAEYLRDRLSGTAVTSPAPARAATGGAEAAPATPSAEEPKTAPRQAAPTGPAVREPDPAPEPTPPPATAAVPVEAQSEDGFGFSVNEDAEDPEPEMDIPPAPDPTPAPAQPVQGLQGQYANFDPPPPTTGKPQTSMEAPPRRKATRSQKQTPAEAPAPQQETFEL